MHRHHIFTLGIILTSIYGINAMADWPTRTATDVWTDSNRSILATERCSDCCKISCWLPDGTYYDNAGIFTETCGCPSGQYDIGFSSCISAGTNGTETAYYAISGSTSTSYSSSNRNTYGLTAGTWAVNFDYGTVKGEAMCSNTKGTANTTGSPSSTSGNYCWCKTTEPGASSWVACSSSTTSSCTNNCAKNCATAMNGTPAFRTSAYGSISVDTPPTCRSDGTYAMSGNQCVFSCPSGSYDIGFSSCISASTNGTAHGYWDFNGRTSNTTTYGLTAGGQWGVTLYTGDKVTGIASCNSTNGSAMGVTTTTEFSNTSNGRYCWCKMTSPAASLWVFNAALNTADSCASSCALYCGYYVRNNSACRTGVFGSVGN